MTTPVSCAGGQLGGQGPVEGRLVEDYRLASWVQTVVSRWAATGISARDRAALFTRLLHELVAARISGTVTNQFVSSDPNIYADRFAARPCVQESRGSQVFSTSAR